MSTETIISVTSSFARPADTTAYVSGDLIADSTTAGSVHPLQFPLTASSFELQRVNLYLSSTVTASASFRLHMYLSSPTVANGDNAAWSTSSSSYIDSWDLDGTTKSFTDVGTAIGYVTSSARTPLSIVLSPSSMTFYGILEARASYTPTSAETVTVTLTGKTYS